MKTYVIVGSGVRGFHMFGRRLTQEIYKDDVKFAGIYDPNPLRAAAFSKGIGDVPVFDDFDKMMGETKPHTVIVTTPDAFHHIYIIRALEAGCDVITEKPMTVNEEYCNAILEAEKRTGKNVQVIFNMRYMPYSMRVKELLMQGIVGEILHVDLRWRLDTVHGADYFRRWHRYMRYSGSLLLHKSTHHFDLMNWFLGDYPKAVSAMGDRRFYGPTRKERGERCLTCPYKDSCEFYWNIDDGGFHTDFYLNTESADGYIRDACVFADDIDIYDTMSVQVEYQKRAQMSYSLVAYSPYEAWDATITGVDGRLEVGETYNGEGLTSDSDKVTFFNRRGERIIYNIPKTKGDHGGGDDRLIRSLVYGDPSDPLGRKASSWDGAMSMMIGAAANQSIKTGKKIEIDSLLNK